MQFAFQEIFLLRAQPDPYFQWVSEEPTVLSMELLSCEPALLLMEVLGEEMIRKK